MSKITFLSSCSINQTAKAPTPEKFKQVTLGSARQETVAHLGLPRHTEQQKDLTVDIYEFSDCDKPALSAGLSTNHYHDNYKSGLSTVATTSLVTEDTAGRPCRGNVSYDIDNKVVAYQMVDKNNQRLWFSSGIDSVSAYNTYHIHTPLLLVKPAKIYPLKTPNQPKTIPIIKKLYIKPAGILPANQMLNPELPETSPENSKVYPLPAEDPAVTLCIEKLKKSAWYSINIQNIRVNFQNLEYQQQIGLLNVKLEAFCLENNSFRPLPQ